ncbi:Response regulator rcp1 [Stieleria neptunia]|uniref:Response regulator rcp1 n=1 Tax=Stieleria neptunia TaxID=2527979 RepID=A0A518HLV9_9BACT|nr:response regulator [Stieleria neptunia]QDV41842.1 Response regulator rcp1 [Stieleria neptunia]
MVDWSNQPILIVEDSPEDFEATVRALRSSGLRNSLYRCSDGDEALDYLHRRGDYASVDSAPRPGIILLDLNLPGTDGREVLEEIKQDHELKRIPVVVLTTSTDERDIEACYEFGANSYIQKPVDLAGFVNAIQRLKDYWFQIVVFPKTDD